MARLLSARSNDRANATPQGWNRSAWGANPGNQDVSSINPERVEQASEGVEQASPRTFRPSSLGRTRLLLPLRNRGAVAGTGSRTLLTGI